MSSDFRVIRERELKTVLFCTLFYMRCTDEIVLKDLWYTTWDFFLDAGGRAKVCFSVRIGCYGTQNGSMLVGNEVLELIFKPWKLMRLLNVVGTVSFLCETPQIPLPAKNSATN